MMRPLLGVCANLFENMLPHPGRRDSWDIRMRQAGDTTRATEVVELWPDGPPPSAPLTRTVDAIFAGAAADALKRGIWSLETVSRGVVQASTDCLELLDANGRVRFANPTASRILGLPEPLEEAGNDWVESWSPDARLTVVAALATVRAGGTVRFRERRKAVDGETRCWDVALSPILDGGMGMLGVLAASRDMSATAYGTIPDVATPCQTERAKG